MADLRRDRIEAWFARLPDDVRSAMPDGTVGSDEAGASVTEAMKALASPEQVLTYIAAHQDSFLEMGRARRIRFLAWLMKSTYPQKTGILEIVTDEDPSGDGQGVMGKVAPVFLEDVRALVEALGPRAARGVVDAETIAAVAGAGYELASEMEMRQGGAI